MIIKRNILKEQITQMPKVGFNGKSIVIQTLAEAENAVSFLSTHSVVGIDTETKPSFKRGESHKVALIQIATQELCFLFRLNMIGMPSVLVDLLENPSVTKVGLSLRDDFMALHKRAEFHQQSWVELQDFVKDFGIQDKSLQKIYAILFSQKISKSQRLSNWEADVLSDAQKLYAATDAWACLKIYDFLMELKRTGKYENEKIIEKVEDK